MIYKRDPKDDSLIGTNVAAKALTGDKLRVDVTADVNEAAAIVFDGPNHFFERRLSSRVDRV